MTSIEVCPGVFIDASGAARGPGLEAALALAADVMTLNAWALKQAGREWAPLSWSGPHATCCLTDRVAGLPKAFEANTLEAAIRAAADAVRKGKV